jgi:hypothetical protein
MKTRDPKAFANPYHLCVGLLYSVLVLLVNGGGECSAKLCLFSSSVLRTGEAVPKSAACFSALVIAADVSVSFAYISAFSPSYINARNVESERKKEAYRTLRIN